MHLKIKSIKLEGINTMSIIFEKPLDFHFYPGQYLDVELPINAKLDTRAFSIASSPTEDFLMITFRIRPSEFKKYLLNLKPGDQIETSHPAGTFTLDESSPAIFLSGGVGITPFRSMIKYTVDNELKTSITLIYSNSDQNFLFKKELENWAKILSNLQIIYINTMDNGRLTLPKLSPIVHKNNHFIYYLAGPPGFVDSMEEILLKLRVDEINIRFDRFDGY